MSAPTESPAARTLSERLGFRPAVVEVGPLHPAVRRVVAGAGGTASFLVTLDDDRIEALEVEIGLGHRGFEKELESRPWLEGLPYVARLGYGAGPIAQVAYCLALEGLAGVPVPESVAWARTAVCELARITDHFARIAAIAAALGASDAERVAERAGRRAMAELIAANGGGPRPTWLGSDAAGGVTLASAVGASAFAAGTYAAALRWGQGESHAAARASLQASVDRLVVLLLDHPITAQRLLGVAPLTAADALALGVTGPCLRASGIARDARRDAPVLAYGALDFDVPIGSTGDDWDRLAVVLEEIRQSVRIVEQCAVQLAPAARLGEYAGAGDEPSSFVVPAGEVEIAVESSTGRLGFTLFSDGGERPRRVRCRAPSFFHAQALPAALVGSRLDDLLPTVALFHLVSGECDR